MAYTTEQLYQLLPAIYRIRDAERGEPLRGLIEVIAQQAAVIEADIARLYDNWFIETCDEWVVPYIGDLLGVRGLNAVSEASISQRARVANTLGYRRRKGTASMLEQLARDTTGWPARVVEYFQLTGSTQYVNHIRPLNLRTPDLRERNTLDLLEGPFDRVARTVNVRNVDTGLGKHNVMNVGIFLWRLQAFPISRAPAFRRGAGLFTFSQLGQDVPLFTHPLTETDPAHLAEEVNVPAPIRRLALHASLSSEAEKYYGAGLSLRLWEDGVEVERSRIVACNLTDWQHRPEAGRIAVDPVLGRIVYPEGKEPDVLHVDYSYGFSGEVGGGCYPRTLSPPAAGSVRYAISKSSRMDTLRKALARWTEDGQPNAIFEIEDSAVYAESLKLEIPAGQSVEIRAADQQRPIIRLTRALSIAGALPSEPGQPGGTLSFDGLLFTGHRIELLAGGLESLHFEHCTLVPGWAFTADGVARAPERPSLIVLGANNRLNIELTRTITGSLVLPEIERVTLTDSLVDGLEGDAIRATRLWAGQCTVLGRVRATLVEQASNSIFRDPVIAERQQEGCVRFCYLPLESSVPRRYRCEPDTAIEKAIDSEMRAQGAVPPAARRKIRQAVLSRLHPRFTSLSYGQPGYGQLHSEGPVEIRSGAEDQAEMGVFHHLLQPQREGNLRASLSEYLRVGLAAGLFYVT